MNPSEKLKLFSLSALSIEKELDKLELNLSIDLIPEDIHDDKDEIYYPQFDRYIRDEAKSMASHYELFYCLEKSIRNIIREKLQSEVGANWWDSHVPNQLKENVQKNIDKELESGVTPRSSEEIDYTTFGELGEIVRQNWPYFNDTFNNQKAFTKVMTSLNVLRGPIAHCGELAEDEVLRLQLTLRDWFRLME